MNSSTSPVFTTQVRDGRAVLSVPLDKIEILPDGNLQITFPAAISIDAPNLKAYRQAANTVVNASQWPDGTEIAARISQVAQTLALQLESGIPQRETLTYCALVDALRGGSRQISLKSVMNTRNLASDSVAKFFVFLVLRGVLELQEATGMLQNSDLTPAQKEKTLPAFEKNFNFKR